jgi:DNA-binding response OmpR family regulator
VGARILVVDDEPNILRMLRLVLTAKGYEVMEARSGEEALQLVRSKPCDLVLLDINLPGISGIDVCRELRPSSKIVIIMMSAGLKHKANCLDAGANDYLPKPFAIPQALSCLESNLQSNGST